MAGAKEIQYNEVPLHFGRSRLLFLEFTCVGDGLGAHCATERPASRVRFVNAAGFTALTALSEDPRPSVLVAVHNLSTQEPVVNAQALPYPPYKIRRFVDVTRHLRIHIYYVDIPYEYEVKEHNYMYIHT